MGNPAPSNWMSTTLDQLLSMISVNDTKPESGLDLVVQEVARQDVTPELIQRWRDLESRSCHVNAFMSPEFLLPAWRYLEPDGNSFLITVEDRQSGRLTALGCFQESPATRELPLPHLMAAKTVHTFRTGMLLDNETASQTLDAWLVYIQRHLKWGGVVIPNLRLDSILAQRIQAALRDRNLSWHPRVKGTSAAFFSPIVSAETVSEHLSAHRRKSLRQKQRILEGWGPVRLRWIDHPDEVAQAIEQFLILEDAGWKGVAGTSLKSETGAADFLRSMATGFFERDRLVLTQLLAGDHVVASSVNLRGASTLFAFKIGWDPQFAKTSPGMLHQNLLLPLVYEDFPDVTCLDSCARPGSFLEEIWPHRINVADVIIPTSRMASSALAAIDSVRYLKNQLKNLGK